MLNAETPSQQQIEAVREWLSDAPEGYLLPTDPADDVLLSVYNPQAYALASSNATDEDFRPVIQTLPDSLEENNEGLDASFSEHLNSLRYYSAEYLDLEYYMVRPLPDNRVSSLPFPFAGAQADDLNVAATLSSSQAAGSDRDTLDKLPDTSSSTQAATVDDQVALQEATDASIPRLEVTPLLEHVSGATAVSEDVQPSLQEITNNIPSTPTNTSTSVKAPTAQPPVGEEEKENILVGPPPVRARSLTRKRKCDLDSDLFAPISGSSPSPPVPVAPKLKKQRKVGPPPLPPVTATPAAFEPTRNIVHPLPKKRYGWKFAEDHSPLFISTTTRDINGTTYEIDPENIATWGAESRLPEHAGKTLPPWRSVDFICLLCDKTVFSKSDRMRSMNGHFNKRHCTGPTAPCYAANCSARFPIDNTVNWNRARHLLGSIKQGFEGIEGCRRQVALGETREGLKVPNDLVEDCRAQYEKDLAAAQEVSAKAN